MKNLRVAWNQVVEHKKSVLLLIGINILNMIAIGLISALFNGLFRDFWQPIITILMAVVDLGIAYFTIISSIEILKKTVFENQRMDFLEMYKEFFRYGFENWKKYLKTYLIWNVLLSVLTAFGIGLISFFFFSLLAGGFAYSIYDKQYYFSYIYEYADAYAIGEMITSILPFILLIIAFAALITVVGGTVSNSISYYGVYKIAAEENQEEGYTPNFSDCLLLAFLPIGVTSGIAIILVVLLVLGFMLNPVFGLFASFIFMILWILIAIANLVYTEVAYVKILMDVNDDQLGNYYEKPVYGQFTEELNTPVIDQGVNDIQSSDCFNQDPMKANTPLPDLPTTQIQVDVTKTEMVEPNEFASDNLEPDSDITQTIITQTSNKANETTEDLSADESIKQEENSTKKDTDVNL